MLSESVGPERVDGQPHGGVVFCADLIPGRPWVHVPITMGYDRNAELLIDEKRAFLADKLARNVQLFFTHEPEVALVQMVRDTRGRFGPTPEPAAAQARVRARRRCISDTRGRTWTAPGPSRRGCGLGGQEDRQGRQKWA